MHATHQFFMTKRSLYLLLWDARRGEEQARLEYWLKLIESFGGDSPVIIVLNKIDLGKCELDRKWLKKKYDNIIDFAEISCEDNTGIDKLRETIKQTISKLEHINIELPKDWFSIKRYLERTDKNYIDYSAYRKICKDKGVDKLGEQILIKFLHDLGTVLSFQDDLRLSIANILNPKWVTNGVYKIINSKEVPKGILETKKLDKILDDDNYPRDKQIFIIDMMRKFKLCFDLEQDKKFLIPELLPKVSPDFDESDYEKSLAFQYHYEFLPSSVISKFIVEMNSFILDNKYWRNGVILSNDKNSALVRADTVDGKIFINIIGQENTRRDFLAKIRYVFEDIHKSIGDMKPKEIIPLPDNQEILIDYEDLLIAEKEGVMKYYLPKIKKKINVKELLDGIDTEMRRRKGKLYVLAWDKIQNLEEALMIETDASVKFKYKKEIEGLKEELERFDRDGRLH